MGSSTAHREPQEVRALVREWLADQGWRLEEVETPGTLWRITAAGPEGRKLNVFQIQNRADRIQIQATVTVTDDHQHGLAQMDARDRANLLWDMRFRLVEMGLDFAGMSEPLRRIEVFQHICYDGLSKDAFLQRVSQVNRGLLVVLWTIGRKLEGG